MAGIPIETKEPVEIVAGDTIKWTRSFADYSAADSWQLSYKIRGTATYPLAFSTEITASGADFLVTIPATTSDDWAAGEYRLFGYLTKSGERVQVYNGALTIKPNHGAVSNAYDAKTRVQRTLEAIEATLEGSASREEQEYEINHGGVMQRVSLFSRSELIKLHSYYTNLRANEIAKEKAAAGQATGRRVLVRFS